MPQTENEEDQTERLTLKTMTIAGFNYEQRRQSFIWAAKRHPCSVCGQPPFSPCLNKTDLNRGVEPRVNRTPHNARIDWGLLLVTLRERGYKIF